MPEERQRSSDARMRAAEISRQLHHAVSRCANEYPEFVSVLVDAKRSIDSFLQQYRQRDVTIELELASARGVAALTVWRSLKDAAALS